MHWVKLVAGRPCHALGELLLTDKEDGVRGAAAVALGQIADEAAVVPLSAVLNPQVAMLQSQRKARSQEGSRIYLC